MDQLHQRHLHLLTSSIQVLMLWFFSLGSLSWLYGPKHNINSVLWLKQPQYVNIWVDLHELYSHSLFTQTSTSSRLVNSRYIYKNMNLVYILYVHNSPESYIVLNPHTYSHTQVAQSFQTTLRLSLHLFFSAQSEHCYLLSRRQTCFHVFKTLQRAHPSQIKVRFDGKSFFPSHTFSFLPLLSAVWHMAAFLCHPVGLQQMWHHYSSSPLCTPPSHPPSSLWLPSISVSHAFLLSLCLCTHSHFDLANKIWETH